jgi:hypothetical protein
MIIKRWNGSAFVKEFPQTKAQLIRNNGDTAFIFDGSDKILPAYLPDSVFDSLMFYGTTTGDVASVGTRLVLAESLIAAKNAADAADRSVKGYYFVITATGTITGLTGIQDTVTSTQYATLQFRPQDGGSSGTANTSSGVLEVGDWFVIESVTGDGTSGTPWVFTASVINNSYELATTAIDGVVRLSSRTTYAALSGNDVVTEGVLKTVVDNAAFASGTHVHGNITNAGAIGSTATLPIITGASGVLTAGAFGTTAGTFAQGNDARLSDARTPTAHTHGNITNVGAIGSTANLPIITTTSGVLTAGSFGTTANTFTQGNDSRLSDARTPTSHVHGDISNAGAITSTVITPATGDAIILSDTSASDALKRGISIGTSTTTFLRNDGTWGTPVDTNTTYAEATTTTLGLVELAFAKLGTSPTLTETTTAGRYYGVSLNSNSQLQVNVPWTDTDTTYSAGEGITLSSTTFRMTNPLYVQTATPTTSVTGTIWYDIN